MSFERNEDMNQDSVNEAHAAQSNPQQLTTDPTASWRQWFIDQGELFEYLVVPVREKLIGDKIDTSAVQNLLNAHAAQGWHVKTITSASVAGRIGPGGVSGLIVVFERRVFR